ncbi:MAG: hypothetical protein AAF360_17020 [Pseudomonadota bacterium]
MRSFSAIRLISALCVIFVALIFWKVWRPALISVWLCGSTRRSVDAMQTGRAGEAMPVV